MSNESVVIYELIEKALNIPGIKVERNVFLAETFKGKVKSSDISLLLEKGPIKSGLISRKDIKKTAIMVANKRKLACSGLSFMAGIPGGMAMAGTIPADLLQFFAFNLRLAQEIAYIYGYEDFWSGDILNHEKVEHQLILFLGVMFGVGGASSVTRLTASNLSKTTLKKLPKIALTKTWYYPIVKKIAKFVGLTLTKDTFAKGVSKAIPVMGGLISGGLTYASMDRMNKRLYEAFDVAVEYTDDEIFADFRNLKREMPEVFEGKFKEVECFVKKYTTEQGIVCPLDRSNVDTDQIIPKQFLKSIKRTGFGVNLFDEWRYLDEGYPGQDNSKRPINPDFVLNQPRYQGANILLARKNFGCGSSREHAPWALSEYGFRTVIAPSFADIFYNNCFKNGMLPIVLSEEAVSELFEQCLSHEGYQLGIDLEKQQVIAPDGKSYAFEIDDFRKHCLLNGLDDIGLTLQEKDAISNYEQQAKQSRPWVFKEV